METKVIIREAIVGKHVEFNSRELEQWESDVGLYSATLPLLYPELNVLYIVSHFASHRHCDIAPRHRR